MDQPQPAGQTHRPWSQLRLRARHHLKAVSAENAEPAGQNQFLMYHMGSTNMTWYHPKYYAALRAERKKHQASSSKQQATDPQASSDKRQALRHKPQASSHKRQAP